MMQCSFVLLKTIAPKRDKPCIATIRRPGVIQERIILCPLAGSFVSEVKLGVESTVARVAHMQTSAVSERAHKKGHYPLWKEVVHAVHPVSTASRCLTGRGNEPSCH